jgi:hypothetical protein
MIETLSDERMGLQLKVSAIPRQSNLSPSRSPTAPIKIFYCLKFESLLPEGPGPRIYIPQEHVCPVIHTGTGVLSA